MTRLIDADALIERLQPYKDKYDTKEFPYSMVHDAFIYEMEKEPTVDAVPVIRCKDCKHYREYAGVIDGYCHMAEWYKRYQYPNDYCSRAERKEE